MSEWIISSSILILVMAAVRTIFKGKIRLTLQYAMWLLVLVRLLVPFSFGSTNISVANLTETAQELPAVQAITDIGNLNVPVQSYEDAYDHVVQQYESEGVKIEDLHGSELEALEYEAYELMKGPDLSEIFLDIAYTVWVAGIMVVGAIFLYTNFRFNGKIRRSRRNLGIDTNGLAVYATDEIDTPCLFGLVRPAIYVTCDVAEDSIRRRHTIEHEATHYRHGDHIWPVLRCLCLAVHWYNPLVWWAGNLSQRDAELACDETTIKRLGEGERAEYGRTLIGMTCRKRGNLLITATTMNAGKRGIRERILLIAKKPKMAVYTLVAVLLIAAIAVGCTFTGARQEEEASADDPVAESSEAYADDGIPNEETQYLGFTDEFVLVYYTGTDPKLVLHRYETVDGEIEFTASSERGDFALIGSISVNHIDLDGKHLYFGTVSDDNWKYLVMIEDSGTETVLDLAGKQGYLCVLDTPLGDFRLLDQQDTVCVDLEDYVVQGYTVTETKFDGQAELPADLPDATITDPEIGTLYDRMEYDKLCIAVWPTGEAYLGDAYRYIIPENQEVFLAAYEKAMAAVEEGSLWASEIESRGWRIVYDGKWWTGMTDGSLAGWSDTVKAEAAADLHALCEAAVREKGIAEPVRPAQIRDLKSATLHWNGTHTITDEYALDLIEFWLSNSSEFSGSSCIFTGLVTLEFENGETVDIIMSTDACATWLSEGAYYKFGIYDEYGAVHNDVFYSLFAQEAIYEASKKGMDEVAQYSSYMNWSYYANQYGSDEAFALMERMRDWAVEDPTLVRIREVIADANGLEGVHADYYAGILDELFEENKADFAQACLYDALIQREETVIRLLAYHWDVSVDEARKILEAELY